MARTEGRKIGLAAVRAMGPNTEIFDAGPGAIPAFGARRRAGTAVSYFVMFRTESGTLRRFTIGKHGAPWTPDTARDKARDVLAEAAKGNDAAAQKQAARKAMTVAELCDRYLADAEAGRILGRGGLPKKASTLTLDR